MPKGIPNTELPCLDITLNRATVVYDHSREQWALPGREMTTSKLRAREACRLIDQEQSKTWSVIDA